MAKVIKHQAACQRKLGLRPASPSADDNEAPGQLHLFQPQSAATPRAITIRHLNAFQRAALLDETHAETAEKLYREAIRTGVARSESYCNLGILHAQKGETIEAIACFSKAVAQDPCHVESHYNLANMYFDANDYHLASLHYQLALRLGPAFSDVHFNLALVYICTGQTAQAMYHLQLFIAATPEEEQQEAEALLHQLQRS